MLFISALLLSGLALATALPTQDIEQRDAAWTWDQGASPDFTIHVSCNATQRAQLSRALNESIVLAQHAKDHIMRFGNSSETYVKYFGNGSATAEPAGWFDKIISGDRTGVIFRCDDIDHLCYQDGWAGHWRGAVSPDQTVICPLSFEGKWSLEEMCAHGYTVAGQRDALYFGADLLHRLYHTHKIAEGVVGEYAETQEEILRLAIDHPEQAVRNSPSLRHFAVEVYAYDIAVPGQGCAGTVPVVSSPASSYAASATPTPTPTPTPTAPSMTEPAPASNVDSSPTECHTHADGVVHCA